MNRRYFFHAGSIGLVLITVFFLRSAMAGNLCAPVVDPPPAGTSLNEFLEQLSVTYHFSLTVPAAMNRTVEVSESMPLDSLIKVLTAGMSTVLLHDKVTGCDAPQLSDLTILSVGKDSAYLDNGKTVAFPTKKHTNQSNKRKPFVIDDMEQYATEVLMRERNAKANMMSREQRKEFKETKKRLRVELKDEIRRARKERKKTDNKNIKTNAANSAGAGL